MEDETLLLLMAAGNAVLSTQEELLKALQLGRAEIVFSRLSSSGVGNNVGASLVYAPGVIDARTALFIDAPSKAGQEERCAFSRYDCPAAPLRGPGPRASKRQVATEGSGDGESTSVFLAHEGLRRRLAGSAEGGDKDKDKENGGAARRTGVTARGVSSEGSAGSLPVALAADNDDTRQGTEYASGEKDQEANDEPSLSLSRTAGSAADPLIWFGPHQSPSVAKAQQHFSRVLSVAISLANKRAELATKLKEAEGKQFATGPNA